MGTDTQLDAIVKHVREYCIQNSVVRLPSICLPPLPEAISYNSKESSSYNSISVDIGIYDDPSNQLQESYLIDIQTGNLAIFGNAQSGKTNLIQLFIRQLAENYNSNDVNFYIMDFGSMALKEFEKLNQVGGVVTPGDDEKIKNLFKLLRNEMEVRKDRLSKLGLSSYSSYKEAGKTDMPFIMLLVDNFVVFKEIYNDYEEDMINISRDGLSLGIMVVATGNQMMDFGYKYINNFANRIALNCNSKDEHGSIFDRCRVEPSENPGRCLVRIDKSIFECQSYLAFDGEREVDRVNSYREFVDRVNKLNANNRPAKKIPCVPHVLSCEDLNLDAHDLASDVIPIGLDFEDLALDVIDLSTVCSIGISGDKGAGKTNLCSLVIDHFKANMFKNDSLVYIVDSYRQQLKNFSTPGIVKKYTVDVDYMNLLIPEIYGLMKQRKEELRNLGLEALDNVPFVLCVIDNSSVFDNGVISDDVAEQFKEIFENSKGLKIAFLFADVPNRDIGYMANSITKSIKNFDVIYSLDNINAIKFFDASMSQKNKYKRVLEPGDAYKIENDGSVNKVKIILSENVEDD